MRKQPLQRALFEAASALPQGMEYASGFLSDGDERSLLAAIETLPLEEARYKGYVARRRTASFGYGYDFDRNTLLPAPPLPDFLLPLRGRVAAWTGIDASSFVQGLVTEYRPGTQLGWHRDVPQFEVVVGVSLAAPCRMRLRRYPPATPVRDRALVLELEPRSAYVLRGEARWGWQHAIAPTRALRCSVTFRTLSARADGARQLASP